MLAPRGGACQRAAVLLLVATMTASCGARWSDEERAAVFARDASGTATRAEAGQAADRAVSEGSNQRGDAGEATAGGTGPTGPPAGQQDTAASGGGPAPCEAPSSAPGVSDDQIRVGSISSLSGPSPGLGASSAAAARAYVAYRNSLGGVCGRTIVLQEGDDGTEGGRYRALVADMAARALGIVGGFALGDPGGLDVIEQTGLPMVVVPSDDRGGALPTLFDVNPPYEDPDAVIGKFRFLYEQGVRRATQVYLAVAQSRLEAQRQARLMRAAGIEVVDIHELPISTLSYDAAARRAANSGADYLMFIGDGRGNGAMARAVLDAGYEPTIAEYFTFAYGDRFIDLAGPAAAEGATTWIWSLPNEEASTNQELAHYLEWMERTAPGVANDLFAADSWAAAKAFFDNLAALPGPITREALVAQLQSVGTFDADGMRAPIRLGAERWDGCMVVMQVQDGRWRRLAPAQGFLC